MVSEAASWAPPFSAFLRGISSPLTALNQGLNDEAVTFDPTFAASSHSVSPTLIKIPGPALGPIFFARACVISACAYFVRRRGSG